jgi:hypothetical protein
MLRINHNAGFFSCCSVKLCKIIQYFTDNKFLPKTIDSSSQFMMYKTANNMDITYDFFINDNSINNEIIYEKYIYIDDCNFQFENYKTVDYKSIIPFVKKYFTPSIQITNIYDKLLLKYNINTDNCIGLYYRGTDKHIETLIDTFDSYYNKLNEIINKENNIQILIQTDSAQFLDYLKQKCINNKNVIIIKENSTSYTNTGIHHEKSRHENYIDIQNLFATFLIISKCKYVLCSSGNCSIWMMYYRGNADNVHQNLNKVWL